MSCHAQCSSDNLILHIHITIRAPAMKAAMKKPAASGLTASAAFTKVAEGVELKPKVVTGVIEARFEELISMKEREITKMQNHMAWKGRLLASKQRNFEKESKLIAKATRALRARRRGLKMLSLKIRTSRLSFMCVGIYISFLVLPQNIY